MLTFVTINYNGARHTIALLRSLERQTEKEFSVLVVDNNSAPDDREALAAYVATSPLAIELLFSDINRGFSGGNNYAIHKALRQGSAWVACINNDTSVEPTFVAHLRGHLSEHQSPGIFGLAIKEDGQTAYAGVVRWLRATLPHYYSRPSRAVSSSPHTKTLYVIGAGMVIHREVFDRIGFFDEHYFLYFEDADFSCRAHRAGIPVKFLDDVVAHHAISQSTRRLGNPLLLRYHMRNAIRFNWRNGPWWAHSALPFWIGLTALKQAGKWMLRRNHAERSAISAGIWDALLGRWGPIDTRPVIGIECESLEGDAWGVARMTSRLVAQLAEQSDLHNRYRVRLYGKHRAPASFASLDPSIFSVHTFGVPSFSFYYYVLLPLRLWWDRPAVMYYPNYMLPLLHPPHVPSLVMLTEDIFREARNPKLPFRYRIAYKIFAIFWAVRRATCIMAISYASHNALVGEGIPAPRVVVNSLAVDPPRKTDNPEDLEGGDYFLYVAQAFPRRHLRETLAAFERIAKQQSNLRLVVIGPDKYEPPFLESAVREINERLRREAVLWHERVKEDELARAYAHALALVYVSDAEAFGLPPLEALSYGTPAILKDAPVHREIFGEHAFFVPNGTITSLAAGMQAVRDNAPHRQRIRKAGTAIVARYTWQAHANRFLDIVDQMCSNSIV